ncbi:OmpA family protein [Chryseobacterium binzhouense]|uniref:OmpA family protein n=1 Tax=Chryseobacterium binzhouense TaxID=2593646 RepID=UPI00289E4BBA|nr:OmpA family protein [Chryseobacterium binzhouense]
MKLGLLLLATLPIATYAQDSIAVNSTNEFPNTFSSGSANIQKFDNKARRFNDWSISVGGGPAFMAFADVTSFYDRKINWGWNAYVSLDKQISHTFGLSLQYQMGKTNQKAMLPNNPAAGVANAWTEFKQVSILGDVNLSNLLRRVDNHSPYRWALHGYAGIGFMGYNTELIDNDASRWSTNPPRIPILVDQKLGIESFFMQAGVGLKYKISRLIDIEGRVMYLNSFDEEFDGGGLGREFEGANGYRINYNTINDSYSDSMLLFNLGLSFKLGKHISHLAWHDPLQEAYYRANVLENTSTELVVCEKGDNDNDGVCDDWDRELNTPAGARVDGAGVALDMDLDGVIDLYDKCVTVPGPVDNQGCPTTPVVQNVAPTIEETINQDFEGIEFELNGDKIRPQSFDKLNHAVEVIKTLDKNTQYLVIGATDTRGSEKYNQTLSQKRANAVVSYLTGKGVPAGMLIPEGRGKSDLKYPECDPATKCPEWKNEANRRVYFKSK